MYKKFWLLLIAKNIFMVSNVGWGWKLANAFRKVCVIAQLARVSAAETVDPSLLTRLVELKIFLIGVRTGQCEASTVCDT